MHEFQHEKLTAARISKGLSKAGLARALRERTGRGSKAVVQHWENGKHVPGGKYLQALSEILGKPAGWFFGR
jgi:transcriptional regulator with XRE-family HTH domain